ncbi:MAG: hypothetical protein C3F12_11345 [Candidatus Methylomirabilota bacterium]|nr:hypothetical protein [candidate division NC10 bacterium]PWB44287.1 MAG: hypothetical protein C3F12_11345 [candidate division NC10 bacterium]
MSEEKKMSDEKKWSVERNFRRLVIILSGVALVLGMIPAFLIGHWLFFLGCTGAFIAWLWVAYLMARRLEWMHNKWLWKP